MSCEKSSNNKFFNSAAVKGDGRKNILLITDQITKLINI